MEVPIGCSTRCLFCSLAMTLLMFDKGLSLFNFIYIERLLLRFYMIKICSFILLLGLKLVLIDTKTKSFLTGSMLMVDSWLNEISKAKSGVDRVVLK
jgi:hypothetical protein